MGGERLVIWARKADFPSYLINVSFLFHTIGLFDYWFFVFLKWIPFEKK
jgi:hypothetical protein